MTIKGGFLDDQNFDQYLVNSSDLALVPFKQDLKFEFCRWEKLAL